MIVKVDCGRKLHGNADAREATLSIKKMRFEPEKSRKRIFLFKESKSSEGGTSPLRLFSKQLISKTFIR